MDVPGSCVREGMRYFGRAAGPKDGFLIVEHLSQLRKKFGRSSVNQEQCYMSMAVLRSLFNTSAKGLCKVKNSKNPR